MAVPIPVSDLNIDAAPFIPKAKRVKMLKLKMRALKHPPMKSPKMKLLHSTNQF